MHDMPRAHSQQTSLAGFEPPQTTDRLFFAVMPPLAVAERIAGLAEHLRGQFGLSGRARPTDHLHVTVHHLGDYAGLPAQRVAAASAAAAGMDLTAFTARFDRVGSFSARAARPPCVLLGDPDAAGWQQLHGDLGKRLAVAHLLRPERAFVPHVTLLYDTRAIATQPVEPIQWPVRELLLIHSLLGRTTYRVLGRWPLRGDAG